jgi:hypothetical protein
MTRLTTVNRAAVTLRSLLAGLAVSSLTPGTHAAEALAPAAPAETEPALPREFAFVLSNGYGEGDHFSEEPATFENLLVNMKQTGFNTIHCIYRDWRANLCRKHGVKMMVDVLAWHQGYETDIRRNDEQRARVRATCEAARGDDAVWGYNLWNERLRDFGRPDGRGVDDYVRLLKQWDPTHPVWVGTYRVYDADKLLSKPGVHAYYDYAWQRGFNWHFADLKWFLGRARSQGGVIGQWEMGSDYARNSYKLNTSIAFGLKVMIWFIGGPFDAKGNIDSKHRFHHLIRIGRETEPLYGELGKIGLPSAVYSTPTTRWQDNKVKARDVPWGLQAFPSNHWLQVKAGEAVFGFFNPPGGADVIYAANHNPYADQSVTLTLNRPGGEKASLEIFDRTNRCWRALEAADGVYAFPLRAAGGELLRSVRDPASGQAVPVNPVILSTLF